MLHPCDLLRPRPALLAGTLGHTYLTNVFLRPSERAAAGLLEEQPLFIAEMTAMLNELDETFIDGYDPSAFVVHLPSLAGIAGSLRERLLVVVQAEYATRFRPQIRLEDLRSRSRAFLDALDAWFSRVTLSGRDSDTVMLWATLQRAAESLRAFLESPELATRWIP